MGLYPARGFGIHEPARLKPIGTHDEQSRCVHGIPQMNAFEFGQYAYGNYGLIKSLGQVGRIYTGSGRLTRSFSGVGATDAGLFAAGVVAPILGTTATTAVGVATALYGAKQVYTGIKDLFK